MSTSLHPCRVAHAHEFDSNPRFDQNGIYSHKELFVEPSIILSLRSHSLRASINFRLSSFLVNYEYTLSTGGRSGRVQARRAGGREKVQK